MAKSHDARKAKRKARLAHKRLYAERLARMRAFPEIVVEAGTAPASLVAAVQAAAREVRGNHARLLPTYFHNIFLEARQHGFPVARARLLLDCKVGAKQTIDLIEFGLMLGQLIQERIPPGVITSYIPFHCLDVTYGKPVPSAVLVTFRSLEQAKGPGGTVYFSRHRPSLVIDGKPRVVAYSTHALLQTCSRTAAEWRSYGGSGDAFAFFDQCIYYEDCTAQLGTPGFTFYNYCHPEYLTSLYAEILGDRRDPTKEYHYRVGYCPCVLEGDFIKAKTLLIPGMRGTPEHTVLNRCSLPADTKEQMLREVESLTYSKLAETRDFSLLRWFHNHGVPQVRHFERDLFIYDNNSLHLSVLGSRSPKQ